MHIDKIGSLTLFTLFTIMARGWQTWPIQSTLHRARFTTFYSSSVKSPIHWKKYPLVFNMPMNCLCHKDFQRILKSKYHTNYGHKKVNNHPTLQWKGHWIANRERVDHALPPCLGRGGPLAELEWTPGGPRGTEGEPASAWPAAPPNAKCQTRQNQPNFITSAGYKGPHAHRLIILFLTVKQERCSDLLLW